MKIDELIKCINKATTTVSAKHIGAEIVFCGPGKHFFTMDYFLSVPVDARVWDTIDFHPDNLDDVIPQDLARTMEVVQRLIGTPVRERFPEKKYWLVAYPDCLEKFGNCARKYIGYISSGSDGFKFMYGGPSEYSEEELDSIKRKHPFIAPAIDAMKEEVKDDDAR